MTPTEIKVELLKAGIAQAEIARRLGISRQAVNFVVNGRCRSGRIRQAIADALGLPVERIWPHQKKKHNAA